MSNANTTFPRYYEMQQKDRTGCENPGGAKMIILGQMQQIF